MKSRPHFIILGGFLGAGKTTAVAQLARRLADMGLRSALITNDQGEGLVDTEFLAAQGFSTSEISGGCFCCRFDALVGAAGHLSRMEPPDVFIAEAVGSCTDLAATVIRPLRRLHGDRFTVSPLSVVIDPLLARAVLGLAPGAPGFSADVRYIYEKQLEEAELIVVNKTDLLDAPALEELLSRLTERFPRAELFAVSAREETNLAPWFHALLFGQPRDESAMEVDYSRYADGEARLGWLNARVVVTSQENFDPDVELQRLAADVGERLAGAFAEVAHLKLTFRPTEAANTGVAVVNLVRGGAEPESGLRLGRECRSGRILINLRAEADPALLESLVRRSVEEAGGKDLRLRLEDLDCFQPGKPVPTHRDTGSEPLQPLSNL